MWTRTPTESLWNGRTWAVSADRSRQSGSITLRVSSTVGSNPRRPCSPGGAGRLQNSAARLPDAGGPTSDARRRGSPAPSTGTGPRRTSLETAGGDARHTQGPGNDRGNDLICDGLIRPRLLHQHPCSRAPLALVEIRYPGPRPTPCRPAGSALGGPLRRPEHTCRPPKPPRHAGGQRRRMGTGRGNNVPMRAQAMSAANPPSRRKAGRPTVLASASNAASSIAAVAVGLPASHDSRVWIACRSETGTPITRGASTC